MTGGCATSDEGKKGGYAIDHALVRDPRPAEGRSYRFAVPEERSQKWPVHRDAPRIRQIDRRFDRQIVV